MAWHGMAAVFQFEHLQPSKAPTSPVPQSKGSKLMERSKADDRSAYAQATQRRDCAMREMLGMGGDPPGPAHDDNHTLQESTSSSERPAAGNAPAPGRLTLCREGRP
jgi:hypothetical protein